MRDRSWFPAIPAALLACAALAGCSDGNSPSEPPIDKPAERAPAVEVVSRNPHPGLPALLLPDTVVVRVLNARGQGVAGVPVQFAVSGGGGSITPAAAQSDADGYARALWVLGPAAGPQTASAAAPGYASAGLRANAVEVPVPAAGMLGRARLYVASTRAEMVELIPRNPQYVSYIQAKIAMLDNKALVGDMIEGRRFVMGRVVTQPTRPVQIASIFPLESMRAEAEATVRYAEATVPVLERFMGLPLPVDTIRVWYGFRMGAAGGGDLHLEDQTTYLARTPANRLPFEATTAHEISHSYMGHEGLNQFLELYAYNVLATGSADARNWTHTRGYTPDQASNEGVHALLDIYRLVGPDVMARAYRAVLPLRPPFGQVLSAAAQQAFAAAVPESVRPQVAAKIAAVRF